ncbi:MAG: PLP-dependent aminotransferase family protein [Clostridia bacterium]|nr:PLP-dependent aminotransferase family protein [Clostridia bacterium]
MLELFKTISLDKDNKTSLYMQLYKKLKDMIDDGTLVSDYRLPSIRQLSEVLNVNQVTVVSAFKSLEKDGYIYSKPGSGTYVRNTLPLLNDSAQAKQELILDELYHHDDIALINNGQIKIQDNTINFASATPTPDLFPVEDFKIVLNEVLERDKGNAFGYQDSQGFYPIRECICETLRQGTINCNPESIQIISGAQQGIDIISKAFLKQGDYVITESPTYTGAIAVFKSRGAEIADIELSSDGPNLNILEYNLKKYKPKLIYTIPSFQNPTGYSYANHKREEILKLAEKYNAYIIEDDYISDLDFEAKNFVPMKAMDKYDRVIFIKSFSKIFMPGLRLGFMIVPASLHRNILEAKHTTDISTSGLIQRAFDLYIRRGYWDKHFRFMYDIYKDRYFKTIEVLNRNIPSSVSYTRPGGGLNIWLQLPYGFSVNDLFKHCTANNMVFAPGKIFYSGNTPQKLNNIRLSFAAVYNEQIEQGIVLLCRAIEQLQKKQDHFRSMPIL